MLNKFGWEDKVYKRLNEFLNTDGKDTYCVFDFDNTCVIHDIQEVTYNYMIDNLVFKMDKETFAENLKKDVDAHRAEVFISAARALAGEAA